MHGKVSAVEHDGTGVFAGLPSPIEATRYHSLTALPGTVPECLEANARTADGVIMGLRHRRLPIHGVQFHPESIETTAGHAILRNFLELARRGGARGGMTAELQRFRGLIAKAGDRPARSPSTRRARRSAS
jgi:GMP synthase-like glutamine amidotransferase